MELKEGLVQPKGGSTYSILGTHDSPPPPSETPGKCDARLVRNHSGLWAVNARFYSGGKAVDYAICIFQDLRIISEGINSEKKTVNYFHSNNWH